MIVNFCFHRVNDNPMDHYSLNEYKLINLLKIFNLFPFKYRITFDDGYKDSYEFIKKYSTIYNKQEWIFFVCPIKCVKNENLLWDNESNLMASREELQSLENFPNVRIGNHTNNHLRQSELSDDEFEKEYRESLETFNEYFSDDIGLAFPYGTPSIDFDQRGVEYCKSRGIDIWSTEARADQIREGIHQRIVIRDEPIYKIVLKLIYYLYVKPIVAK